MSDEPKTFTLEGWLAFQGSKSGVRFLELQCMEPYPHAIMLQVYGDEGRTDDDAINADLFDKLDAAKVAVTFWLDEHWDATTTPSRIRLKKEQAA